MDISKITKRRSVPGILIYSMTGGLLFANEESIVLLPELRKNIKNKSRALDEIHKLCEEVIQTVEKEDNENCNLNSAILRDREGTSYYMRAFYLGGAGTGISQGQILILIEKIILRHEPNFENVQSKFGLTSRELEVLKLLSTGLTTEELSEKLLISEDTIKDHIKKLMSKMGVSSRSAIIARLK